MQDLSSIIALLFVLISFANCEKMCRRFVCDSKTNDLSTDAISRICMYEKNTAKDLFKVLVYPTMCKENEYCDYYSILQDDTCLSLIYSICRPKPPRPLYFTPKVSYPGEPCDSYNVLYDCPHGRRQCYYGRCYGTYTGDDCVDSKDCMPGYYCDENKKTKPYIGAGIPCTVDESCGRMARCANVSKPSSVWGKVCVNYFSLPEGTSIEVKSEYDVFLCDSMVAESEEESVDYLDNFRVNVKMKCGIKYKSVNKGLNCYEYRCDVTDKTGQFAKRSAQCDCFMDNTGIPVCGPMNGDIEFDQYRAAFRSYMEQSKYCHPMRDLDFECGNQQAYYNFKCEKARVKSYYTTKASSCLYDMVGPSLFPDLYETNYWCSKAAEYNS